MSSAATSQPPPLQPPTSYAIYIRNPPPGVRPQPWSQLPSSGVWPSCNRPPSHSTPGAVGIGQGPPGFQMTTAAPSSHPAMLLGAPLSGQGTDSWQGQSLMGQRQQQHLPLRQIYPKPPTQQAMYLPAYCSIAQAAPAVPQPARKGNYIAGDKSGEQALHRPLQAPQDAKATVSVQPNSSSAGRGRCLPQSSMVKNQPGCAAPTGSQPDIELRATHAEPLLCSASPFKPVRFSGALQHQQSLHEAEPLRQQQAEGYDEEANPGMFGGEHSGGPDSKPNQNTSPSAGSMQARAPCHERAQASWHQASAEAQAASSAQNQTSTGKIQHRLGSLDGSWLSEPAAQLLSLESGQMVNTSACPILSR